MPPGAARTDEDKQLRATFDDLDVDGSGTLDADELAAACEKLQLWMSPEEVHSEICVRARARQYARSGGTNTLPLYKI